MMLRIQDFSLALLLNHFYCGQLHQIDARSAMNGLSPFMASREKTLNSLGKHLVLLDNCCNVQISNWRELFSSIYQNNGSSANTLGGNYSPAQKCDSPFIGCSLFDAEANVMVLSYKHLWDQGRVYHYIC